MKKLNLMAYRLSINCARIFPNGTGEANPKGVKFYSNLINELLKNGIEPFITLYHWDLPQALQDRGGWLNRDTIEAYARYADFCFKTFGSRVKKWGTFNEAWIVSGEGFYGMFQPPAGISDDREAEAVVSHHINVAHAKAVNIFRKRVKNGYIGITHVSSAVYANGNSTSLLAKREIADGIINRWYLDPCLKGTYPKDIVKYLKKVYGIDFRPSAQDMKLIKGAHIDYVGLNTYAPFRVHENGVKKPFTWKECMWTPAPKGKKKTEMGWEVEPQCIYDAITRADSDYNSPDIFITENGAAFADKKIVKGVVQDDDRLDFYKGYIAACNRAVSEGANLKGYLAWSLLDNFEWSHGYSKRFGLVRVDYKTQKRMMKKSGLWYSQLIKNNGFEL
jgi:beta-glucosidase